MRDCVHDKRTHVFTGKGDFMEDNNYLDAHAAKLRSEFPMCGGYIVELLAKYKKTLKEDLVDIGSTPDEVINRFEHDVRKHCVRATDIIS